MSTQRIIELANGKRSADDIAEILGVSRRHIVKTARKHNLYLVPWQPKSSIDLDRLRALAAEGLFAADIAREFGLARSTISNAARKHGIQIKRCPPPTEHLRHRRPPAARRIPPEERIASVEEWIARKGSVPKYEPGTLDQILADTFASVGKVLTYSGGKGTSWTPYRIGKRNMNKAQVIAEANKIREKQGKPLLGSPSRPSPKNARSLSFGRAA